MKNFHKIHYAARALGGVGLIIVEATAVEPRGRITDKDLYKSKSLEIYQKDNLK